MMLPSKLRLKLHYIHCTWLFQLLSFVCSVQLSLCCIDGQFKFRSAISDSEPLFHSGQILEAGEAILSHGNSTSGASRRVSKVITKAKITTIHMKARMSPYPGTNLQRFKVEDDKVPWQVRHVNYVDEICCHLTIFFFDLLLLSNLLCSTCV